MSKLRKLMVELRRELGLKGAVVGHDAELLEAIENHPEFEKPEWELPEWVGEDCGCDPIISAGPYMIWATRLGEGVICGVSFGSDSFHDNAPELYEIWSRWFPSVRAWFEAVVAACDADGVKIKGREV